MVFLQIPTDVLAFKMQVRHQYYSDENQISDSNLSNRLK